MRTPIILLLITASLLIFGQTPDSAQAALTEIKQDNSVILLLYFLGAMGLFIHFGVSISTEVKLGVWRFGHWLRTNWLDILLGIASYVTLMLTREEVVHIAGFEPLDGNASFKLYSFTAGYLGREWIYRIVKLSTKPKT